MTQAPAAAVEVSGLSAGYPGVLALQGVDLRLAAGTITALVGANGSGKSTLFSALLGLRAPLAGTIRLHGKPPQQARRRNVVSYVPQHDTIDHTFPLTVAQMVMMGRIPHQGPTRRPRRADRAAVAEALEQVGLAELRRRTVGELSGGQRRRAFLARSLTQQAPLMLLDEPFAGVDRGSEELITATLHALRDAGTTVLVSTHHLDSLADLADEVVLLHRRVLAAGPPSAVLTESTLAGAFGTVLADDGGADEHAGEDPASPAGRKEAPWS